MYSGCDNVRPKNPRQSCNLLSFLTFGYTIPLFKKGFKGDLQESDIYEVPDSCNSKKCGDKIDKDWHHCKTALQLLFKRFGPKYFLYTSIHLAWQLIDSTIYPYAMSRFIAYFEKNQTNISKFDANYYGGAIILFLIIRTLWIYNYFMLECTLGLQIRASLSSLIYRKVVKLRPEQAKGSSMGSVVTVLTKDIRTVETTIWPLSDMIIGCFKLVYVTYLMYIRIGMPSLMATGVMLFVIVIEVILSRFVLKSRLRVGKMSDKRLQFTKEILSALKIIKMYTWEAFFHDRVCKARKKETTANLRTWCLGSIITAFGTLSAKLLFPIFLLTYMSWGYPMNIELVYYLMGLFKEHATVIGNYLPSGFGLGAEFYASVIRIGRILNMDESETVGNEKHSKNTSPDKAEINLRKVYITIDGNSILDNVSFFIDQPGLYVITGALGSGKSSVLKVILEEYPVSTGTLKIVGNISYASQDPWLFPATVKQNILFGQPFNRERYDRIIEICSLEYDFDILPNGDDTVVIDGGSNLSKGQQARVNLARAIYKESDIYLLDDPLASLDVKVQDDIFHGCIRHFLKDKIVIFVTQNTEHLKYGKRVVVLERGQIRSNMQPNELADDALVNLNDSKITENSGKVADFKGEEKAHVNIYHEDKNTGGVDVTYYFRYVKYGGGVLIFAVLLFVFFGAQFTESYADKLMSVWVDYQQDILKHNQTNGQNSTSAHVNTLLRRDNTFDLYIIMIIVSTAIDLLKSYWFLVYCRKASIKFHKLMSHAIINCVMPFFDNHFIGNILNRFSYDLDHIDEVFPFLLKELIVSLFAIGATLTLIVTVNWIFLLISALFFFTLALMRHFYIPTARALKRLGAITRSPYIGHLNATVEGLSTIKAFKAESLLKNEFDKHQDLAISVAYMETTTAIAFSYVMDIDYSIFISTVILTFLFTSTDTSVGNVGLALTQIFSMSAKLQWLIRAWASLEQCMTSVERVIEYIEIPQENQLGQTPPKWPKYGRTEFQNVNLVYNFESKVLKNISFEIEAGENIGIVGRTGAGKSSLISALFRLYEYQGKILIDGVDIANVSLDLLRKNVSIIPQDPIIFAGTIRENVDPYATVLDKDIWKVLKTVKLHSSIPNLDADIFNLTLTTGQKQLLCLARALLKNNKIVVMDEPTANFDPETDALVHGVIKQYFDECTLIIVAHRLKSTIDCDKVIVMDNGEIVEFDQPKKLLEDEQSLFYQMMNIME